MSNKRQHGMTLVELIIAMVIVGVGLAGVLGALSKLAVTTTDPMIEKQMMAIAEGMMEEVQLQPYTTAIQTVIPAGSCDRTQFQGTWDYNNYNVARPICQTDGTPVAMLAAYRVSVTVANEPAGPLIPAGAAAGTVSRISVTVTNGTRNYALQGWRTNF